MRRTVVALGLLISALPASAANPGDGPAGSSGVLHAQAVTYANQMMIVLRHVEQEYVRPVPMAKLVEASLEGLYETAREPMPASLRSDLARAKEAHEFSHILQSARERLGDVEALRDRKALFASLHTLPRALDPFSGLPDNDRRLYSARSSHGVGLDFEATPAAAQMDDADRIPAPTSTADGKHFGPLRVATVLPGGPAQRAGIRPGDVLTLINDTPPEAPDGMRLFQQLFLDAEASGHRSLKLTFERPGLKQPFSRELLPVEFRLESVFGVGRRTDNSWDFMLDHDNRIGYLRLGFIDEPSAGEMEEAISQLRHDGMKGLIFDLRGCPGGFVDPAEKIAKLFIKSGVVAILNYRKDGKKVLRIDDGSGVLEGIPTIALIDEETRGGGEMIAAVLQDHKVARIAGRRSFGKGSVQNTLPVDGLDGGRTYIQLRLTAGSFTGPNGKNMTRFPDSKPQDDWGIRPDPGLEYPVSPALAKQIKEWMILQMLRPGGNREPLPLDDPDNDPLREFARRELLKQIK